MKLERARKVLNKKFKIEKRQDNCEHEWELKTHERGTGKAQFLGRTLTCTKCNKTLSSKIAGQAAEFNKIVESLSKD